MALSQRLPVFTSLRGYRASWLRGDVIAGLTVWAVLVPEALAITTGILALAAGLARLGFLANFISEPVLKGFIVGLALTIIIGQVPKLLGIEKGSGDFFEQLWDVISRLGDSQWQTVIVGVLSLAVVLVLRRVAPIVPAPLVAVALGILAVYALNLQHHGVKIVGHIDSGLPSFGLPSVPAKDYLKLTGSAVGVMLVGFAEGLGAAKTYAARNGYQVSPNRELIGLGTANLAAGLSSGMVVNGSLSKTAVNGAAGAKTQMSGLVVAVLTILTLLFLTGLFEDLPEATLGAVVIAALIELVDISALRALYRTYTARLGQIYGPAARADFIAAVAAMLGVLVFDTLPGLFIGIAVSLLLLLYRVSRPNVAVLGQVPGTTQWADVAQHPEDQTVPGVAILRVESGVFFANADHVRVTINDAAAAEGVHAVVLDAETVPFVDVTAARMLDELTADLHRRGVRLVIARDVGQVRDVLASSGDDAAPEYFPSVRAAVDAVRADAAGHVAGPTSTVKET